MNSEQLKRADDIRLADSANNDLCVANAIANAMFCSANAVQVGGNGIDDDAAAELALLAQTRIGNAQAILAELLQRLIEANKQIEHGYTVGSPHG